MIYAIFQILYIALDVIFWIIIAQVIISWLFVFKVLDPYSRVVATIVEVIERLTAPIYRPIRKIMPDFGGIDLSPMVVLFGVIILQRAVLPGIYAEIGQATVL